MKVAENNYFNQPLLIKLFFKRILQIGVQSEKLKYIAPVLIINKANVIQNVDSEIKAREIMDDIKELIELMTKSIL